MSITVRLSDAQARVVESALSLYSRIQIGQLEYVAEALIGNRCCDKSYTAKYAELCRLKYNLFDLPVSANLGIHNPEVPDAARTAWDLSAALAQYRGGVVAGKGPTSKEPTPLIVPSPDLGTCSATMEKVFAEHAGRAMFVSQWADYQERVLGNGIQGEIMDLAPPTPDYFVAEGWKLLGALCDRNRPISLVHIILMAERADGKAEWSYWNEKDVGEFGHYIAMQHIGHGVSWFDSHAKFHLTIPHGEAPELDDATYPEPPAGENDEA